MKPEIATMFYLKLNLEKTGEEKIMDTEGYSVEISDIFEPDQEDFVIELIKDFIDKDYDSLKKYFEETDTITVSSLSEKDAQDIVKKAESLDLTARIISGEEEQVEEEESEKVVCPRCGFVLEFLDWRCPECYYEFPEYKMKGDDELEEERDI